MISSCCEDTVAVRKCLVTGYFAHVARLGSDGQYRSIRGDVLVTPHYNSVVSHFGTPPEYVLFQEIVFTSTAQMREVTRIDPMWLLDLAKHYYSLNT